MTHPKEEKVEANCDRQLEIYPQLPSIDGGDLADVTYEGTLEMHVFAHINERLYSECEIHDDEPF